MKGLPQDLNGGKSVNRENIRVILDSDHYICWLYPLDKDHEQHYQDSIEFVEDQTDLYYLQTKDMNWTTYDNLTGNMTCGTAGWGTFLDKFLDKI